jgi:carboxyl-terminal processing protease
VGPAGDDGRFATVNVAPKPEKGELPLRGQWISPAILPRPRPADTSSGGGRQTPRDWLGPGERAFIRTIVPRGSLARLGNLPPMYFWEEHRTLPQGVGYVRFSGFFEPDVLIKAVQDQVKACTTCDGFIIDVRGNPGGIAGLSMGVAGWFVEASGQQLGTMYLRDGRINFAIFPRPEPFRGPLAILVDGCSGSTSEIFAGGLKDLGRARLFGTRTAGAALPSVFERLPNGDGFQYAIANYVATGGKPLEGIGAIPDEDVKVTRRDLLEGRDPVVDAAVGWIHTQKKK